MAITATGPATAAADVRARTRAGIVSLVAGTALLAAKFFAYRLTESAAVLSDALESIVNVVAAVFALGGILFAGRPADRNHPYGHGKIEFFSAAFEGGLIAFAAAAVVFEAVATLLRGASVQAIDAGAGIVAAAGLGNLALGVYLVRTGRKCQSLTLVADGQHVLSDFWTSAGVVGGLLAVRFTGVQWLDPAVALLVGANLARTGLRLVRHAAGGLLDEEDTALLQKLIESVNQCLVPGIIRVHSLRAIRSGRFAHVDAHLVLPEFWSVQAAHDAADAFERQVIQRSKIEGEIVFHTDPCRRAYCAYCDIPACPIRGEPFRYRTALSVDEAVHPDRPPEEAAAAAAAGPILTRARS